MEDVRVVIFCVALSDYDQLGLDASGGSRRLQNKMIQSRDLFEATIRYQLRLANSLVISTV